MGYWRDQWQNAWSKYHRRSISSILSRIFFGSSFIFCVFYFGNYIDEKYNLNTILIGCVETGLIVGIFREMLKDGGSIHDLFEYFGNRILKKKVVTYLTENKYLQSRISELEAKNIELMNEKSAMKKRMEALEANDNDAISERRVESYLKMIIFYMEKANINNYADSNWAVKTSKAMELKGLSLTDKTLRSIRAELLKLDEKRKDKP